MVLRRVLALLGVVTALLGSAETAVAQGNPAATTMLRLRVADIPAVGLAGFTGTVGDVSAAPPQQLSTWDGGDTGGVLGFVSGWYGTPAGPGTGTASVNDSVSARDASAGWAGVGVRLRSGTGPNVISIGSLHTYARCTTAPASDSQQAYAASDANTLYLFDSVLRPLGEGTLTVSTTGAELGLATVGTATLRVTVHRVQETGPLTAHAAVEVSADATLSDQSGSVLYDGHLLDFTLGDVTVDCAEVAPPSPTTTTTTTTTTATTTTGPTTTTTGDTTTSVTPPSPTTTEVSGGGGSLAGTGFPAAPLLSLGVLLVVAGGTVLLLRRARRVG